MNTVAPMSPEAGNRTKKRYVCARCWSELTIRHLHDDRLVVVICETCQNCPGYVTKSYVERAQQKSMSERMDARYALRDAVPWLRGPKKNQEQILKELGF